MQIEYVNRRRVLTQATGVLGFVGALLAAVPFVGSMRPSARALARGGPIEIDASRLDAGRQLSVESQGKPLWVLHRTLEMTRELNNPTLLPQLRDPESKEANQQPAYAANPYRSVQPEYFVVVGLCTHLGCVPLFRPKPASVDRDWPGGYFCPCHGSKFDLAGRVYNGVPAPTNLVVPPHRYIRDSVIQIGIDPPDVEA